MRNIFLLGFVMLLFSPGLVSAQQTDHPKKLVLEVEWEPDENTEVIVAEGLKFSSVETLKKFLGQKPSGTTVVWDPGCVRLGNKPLLSSMKEVKEFGRFLEKRGIRFVTTP